MNFSPAGFRVCRIVTVLAVAACAVSLPPRVYAAGDRAAIERVFAAYAAGDTAIVAKTFAGPKDFEPLGLADPGVLAGWLGRWQPAKAAFLMEVAAVANVIAPPKTWPILVAGRQYVVTRPAGRRTAADDEFESIWHRTALGLLQKHAMTAYEEMYLSAIDVRERTPAPGGVARDRLALARAIMQEQRCSNDRFEYNQTGEVAEELTRAAGQPLRLPADLTRSMVASMRARDQKCLSEAAARFDAAAGTGEGGAEAYVRGAWTRFQLRQLPEAMRTLDLFDKVGPGDDRVLAYWAALIRARIADGLGHPAEAERAYRAALAASPDAQSAGIGLSLTLFKMGREDDADELARQVRTRPAAADDPWWSYAGADRRFVEAWIEILRGARS